LKSHPEVRAIDRVARHTARRYCGIDIAQQGQELDDGTLDITVGHRALAMPGQSPAHRGKDVLFFAELSLQSSDFGARHPEIDRKQDADAKQNMLNKNLLTDESAR